MPRVRSSTAVKSPKRLVTLRNSMKGFAEGSIHGANFRRTGPTALAAIPHLSERDPNGCQTPLDGSLSPRLQIRPQARDDALDLRFVAGRGEEPRKRVGIGIDGRIADDIL